MQIHLVRHGQTDWNAAKRIQGTIDIDLNATGRRQAEELGTSLASAGIAFTGIRTSTMKRARSTAQILGSFLKLPADEVPNLHEMDFGSWEGLTWPEVESQYPAAFQRWLKDRRTTRVPHGDSSGSPSIPQSSGGGPRNTPPLTGREPVEVLAARTGFP